MNQKPPETFLSKSITWTQLLSTMIGLIAIMGGAVLRYETRLEYMEWSGSQRQKQVDLLILENKQQDLLIVSLAKDIAEIKNDVRWMRSQQERRR